MPAPSAATVPRSLRRTALLLALARATAAQSGVVEGRVVDAGTRAPLADVQVRVLTSAVATTTDSAGRFVLRRVPVGVRCVEARRIGYAPVVRADVPVSAGRAASVEIALRPVAATLVGVVVRPAYFEAPRAEAPASTQTLSAEEIRRAPGVQEDVVRALAVLPGAQLVNPVSNDVVVRGSASADNLYVVDGVEVPSINHFSTPGSTSGVLSVFPVALVSDASFSAGGFGVRWGDRTASLTEIALREGSRARASSQLSLSATGVGAIVEGPVGARTTAIVGARRSYYDLLFAALDFPFLPTYTDLTAKLVARPTARDRVSAFVSGAVDRIGTRADDADARYDLSRLALLCQDAYVSGLSWQRTLARGVARATLGRTWGRFRVSQADSGAIDRAPAELFSTDAEEGETSLRAETSVRARGPLTLDGGGVVRRASRLRYRALLPGELRRDAAGAPRPLDVDTAFGVWRGAAFAQATARAAGGAQATLGMRADAYPWLDGGPWLAPRLAADLPVGATSALTLAMGRTWQPPAFAWLAGDPGNRRLRPLRADQAVVGWRRTPRPDVKVQLEVYAKRLRAYPARVFRPLAVFQPVTVDATTDIPLGLEPLASVGSGRALGIEGFAQKRLSESPWYGTATLSVARARFRGLAHRSVRGAFDIPVSGSVGGGWRPNDAWELSGRFRFASGLPTTPFVESGPDAGQLDYARYDAGPRLAPLAQLDVRADRRWSLGGAGQLVTYLDVQGANARRNETYPVFDQRTGRVERQRFLATLPTIGVTWERGL